MSGHLTLAAPTLILNSYIEAGTSQSAHPGHKWPGYKTAPDESGFSPMYGAW